MLRGSQRHQWPCPSSSNFGHPAHRWGHLSWYCNYETGSSLVDGVGAPLACLGAGLWRLHAVTDTCSDRMLQSLCYLRLCLKIGLPTLGWNSVALCLMLRNSSELVFRVHTHLGTAHAVLVPGFLKQGSLQVPPSPTCPWTRDFWDSVRGVFLK